MTNERKYLDMFYKLCELLLNLDNSDTGDRDKQTINRLYRQIDHDRSLISQATWDRFINDNSMMDIPEEFANRYIIRCDELGKNTTGLDFAKLIDRDEFSLKFYNQQYILSLLSMHYNEYYRYFGQDYTDKARLLYCGIFWGDLFYFRQGLLTRDYILENSELLLNQGQYILNMMIEYQNIPLEFYETYISDPRLTHVPLIYEIDLPIGFLEKNLIQYPEKFRITDMMWVNNLTEDLFIELINSSIFKSPFYQTSLWLTVGAYNISETFIRHNIAKINRRIKLEKEYDGYGRIWITNEYNCAWDIIVQNKIDYSEQLYIENMDFIRLDLLMSESSIMREIGYKKAQYSRYFIDEYIIKSPKFNNDILIDLLQQKSIIEDKDFIISHIDKKMFCVSNISRQPYLTIELLEHYFDQIDFQAFCYFNLNLEWDYFIERIEPYLSSISRRLDIDAYLSIDNASERNLQYFIDTYCQYYTQDNPKFNIDNNDNNDNNECDDFSEDLEDDSYNSEDYYDYTVDYHAFEEFYRYTNIIVKEFPHRYTDRLKSQISSFINNIPKRERSRIISSLDDYADDLFINHIFWRIKNNENIER